MQKENHVDSCEQVRTIVSKLPHNGCASFKPKHASISAKLNQGHLIYPFHKTCKTGRKPHKNPYSAWRMVHGAGT